MSLTYGGDAPKPKRPKRLGKTKNAAKPRLSRAQHLWANVPCGDPKHCWIYTGKKLPSRYGLVAGGKDTVLAHRLMWELHNGRPVPAGMDVCHTCDTPDCTNPSHLFLGYPADNMRDMTLKGRSISKLTDAQRDEAIKLYQSTVHLKRRRPGRWSYQKIADHLGVCKATISHLMTGRNWRHHTGFDRAVNMVVKESSVRKKVTPAEAIEIYQRAQAGENKHELAKLFGISFKTADRIANGRAHVKHTGATYVAPRTGTRHGALRLVVDNTKSVPATTFQTEAVA